LFSLLSLIFMFIVLCRYKKSAPGEGGRTL
jgi:hypothetical protein